MTEVGLCDDGEDGEHNGVGFVGISEIFVAQNAFFFGVESFDGLYSALWLVSVSPAAG